MPNSDKNSIEIQRELLAMPEYDIIRRIRGFGVSIDIFIGNYRELKEALEFHDHDGMEQSLFSTKNRHVLDQVQSELMRLFHNFVAASLSLTDHSRRHYRSLYEENDRFPDYQEKIDEYFANNPLARFVKDLRQFCQHYETPLIRSQLKIVPEKELKIRALISKEKIAGFDFSSKSEEYLDQIDDDIDLHILVDEYYDLVVSFYKWFHRRQEEIHAVEFRRVRDKQREGASLVIPEIIRANILGVEQGIMNPDDVLSEFLSQEEWAYIEQNSPNKSERATRILRRIKDKADIDAETEALLMKFLLRE